MTKRVDNAEEITQSWDNGYVKRVHQLQEKTLNVLADEETIHLLRHTTTGQIHN